MYVEHFEKLKFGKFENGQNEIVVGCLTFGMMMFLYIDVFTIIFRNLKLSNLRNVRDFFETFEFLTFYK